MKWLYEKFKKLILLDGESPQEFENQRKKTLLIIILGVAVTFFTIFFIYNFFRAEYIVAIINLIADLVIIFLFYLVLKKNKIRLVSYIGTIYLGIHLILINVFYYDQITNLIWTLSYPLIVLFLLGRQKGLLVLLGFVVVFHSLYLGFRYFGYIDGLPLAFIIEYVGAFFLFFLLSFLFEYVREKSQKKLVESKEKIDKIHYELQDTIEALVVSELKYRSLIDIANDGIIIIQNEKIQYVNQIACDMVNLSRDEVLGRYFFDFIEPSERQRVISIHQYRMSTKEKIDTYETVVLSTSGLRIYVEVNASLMIFEGGHAVIAIIRNISQRKVYEEERNALIDELENTRDIIVKDSLKLTEMNDKLIQSESYLRDALAMKDKFVSILSHDLLNPISGANQLIELLNTEFDKLSDLEKKELLDALNNSSKNIYLLLKNLLTWARIQTNSYEINPTEIDLNFISLSVIDLLHAQATGKGIKVINSIDENTIVFADLEMTKTVFRNLISNAIKFSKDNQDITISCFDKDSKYEVHIKDSGIGISHENLNKLFRLDTKVSTMGTRSEKGSGMGLILCKEFLEKNNGNIWVDSILGQGTTFKFTLPKPLP